MMKSSFAATVLLATLLPLACVTAAAVQCTVAHNNDPAQDDSPAILKAFSDCANDGEITFEDAVDYYALTPVSLTGLSKC